MQNRPNLIFRYFLKGLSIVVPFGMTIFACWYVGNWINTNIINVLFGFLINKIPAMAWVVKVRGLSILLTCIAIVLIGMLGSNFFVSPFIYQLEQLVLEIPVINILYSYVKESTFGFVEKLNKPVLVKFPYQGQEIHKIGFITQSKLYALSLGADHMIVYLPHSYAFSGEMAVFHKDQVTFLDLSTTEAMRLILTGGLSKIKRPLIASAKKELEEKKR
ncbi:MAG: DUF502 domain-containing protein [Bacteroidota bacterium]